MGTSTAHIIHAHIWQTTQHTRAHKVGPVTQAPRHAHAARLGVSASPHSTTRTAGPGGERRREPTSVNATEAKRPLLARPRFVTLRAAATSDLLVGAPWQLLAQTAAGCGRALVSCRVADWSDPTDLANTRSPLDPFFTNRILRFVPSTVFVGSAITRSAAEKLVEGINAIFRCATRVGVKL